VLKRIGIAVAAVVVAVNLVLLWLANRSDDDGKQVRASTSTSPSPGTQTTTRTGAAASLTLTGASGLSGAVVDPTVTCNFPDLEGTGIAVLARAPDSSLLRVRLQQGRVTLVVSSGEGSDYHERAFEGTGVSEFDATAGAVVDAALRESAAGEGTTKGDLAAVTAIEGSARCGNQTPGTSTVSLSGDTAEGRLDAARLNPVLVECNTDAEGNEAVALGIVRVGEVGQAHIKLALTSDGAVTLDETRTAGRRRYRGSGTSTVTTSRATVRADVVEQDATGPAHTIHVEGELTCGSQ
jgi:hypothetical protein